MEYLDVIDANDRVVASLAKTDVYAKKLGHRIVHVFVIHPETKQLFLQVRSPKKSHLPNHYCVSAGGHVHSGETYEEAASRELAEELGVTADLTHVETFPYNNYGMPIHIALFTCEHAGPFTYDEHEVSDGGFYTDDEIISLLEKNELIHPQLTACFERLIAKR